jgi:hypothetical protein
MSAPPGQLESLLFEWESDETLLDSAHFARRIGIQDELDRIFTGEVLHPNSSPGFANANRTNSDLSSRARALHLKLESINLELFNSIRRQIQTGTCPTEFLPLLRDPSTEAPRGLAYDYLDDLIAGVLQFKPPIEEPRPLSPDSVFYQPTPARHIFHLITAAAITSADTFIDLGSGLGHVPLLASICTGATAIGIELDPIWITSAINCAATLNLRNVIFLAQDVREADLSSGTVFYLYTPFTGSTLASVLESLCNQSTQRPIRICTFGPCTLAVGNEPWLRPIIPPVSDQITVFLPRT